MEMTEMDATSDILSGAEARTTDAIPAEKAAIAAGSNSRADRTGSIPAMNLVRRSYGVEIIINNDLGLAIEQEEEHTEEEVEEVENGSIDKDDGIPKYMRCVDRHLGLLEKAHVLEGEREQGDGRDSDE
jgi:hypothetical protein